MTETHYLPIIGDRALSSSDEDRLGFREIAKCIALSLVDRASAGGLVVGLEGAWGSGKSSLLCLIDDQLKNLQDHQRPTVINFRPWLIGNRDALIAALFGELSSELDRIALQQGDATPISISKAKAAGDALKQFVNGISKFGPAIEFVGDASGMGALRMAGQGISALAGLGEESSTAPQLSELKDKLAATLRELDHRIIVTIDDVDRLEPSEAIEILRLVRSVVDLPNVIYLLCYDSNVLAHSIEQATRVECGKAYLEKIVQLTVMVPQPEPFRLRHWFSDELRTIASVKDEEELSRLKLVIDYEGGRQLRTPRSVVRALDAIRFYWPPMRASKTDLADLVWIQLIKDGSPNLYRWVESYCGDAASVSLGLVSVDETRRKRMLEGLFKLVDEGHFDDLEYRHGFAQQLPGVEVDYAEDGEKLKIFQRVADKERDDAIRRRRISSPDHYRLYFALIGPSHAPTHDDFAAIWSALESGSNETAANLLHLHSVVVDGSLTKADLLLERINGETEKVLTSMQGKNLLLAFSQVLDAAQELSQFDVFWVSSLWDRAKSILPAVLLNLQPDERAALIAQMFTRGEAIGWLTFLLRYETFAHGRFGDRRESESEWLFTEEELTRISQIMIERYRTLSPERIFKCANPLSILFAWQQAGDDQGARKFVEENIVSDEGLIQTLEGMTSIVVSSDRGRFGVLKQENLASFLDYDEAKRRVLALRKHKTLGERARVLGAAFDDALSC